MRNLEMKCSVKPLNRSNRRNIIYFYKKPDQYFDVTPAQTCVSRIMNLIHVPEVALTFERIN